MRKKLPRRGNWLSKRTDYPGKAKPPVEGQFRTSPGIWSENRKGYGGVSMTPDWSFVQQLKRIDPNLSVTWNKNRERWVVYEKGRITGLDHIVMRVEYEDGSYKPLDARTLRELEKSRWLWNKGLREFINRLEDEEEQREMDSERAMLDELHNIGDWYALQMMGIPHFQVPGKYGEISHDTSRSKTNDGTNQNIESLESNR
jgi:predicted DNA-binding antitoxin AbrB/MazE fold protein